MLPQTRWIGDPSRSEHPLTLPSPLGEREPRRVALVGFVAYGQVAKAAVSVIALDAWPSGLK